MPSLIKLERVSKSFGSITALENIDFELHENEIVGLVGDNGAGKSTLIKILAGVHQADSGNFFLGERRVNLKRFSVADARKSGIETVHQDRALGEKQSLWRNFFMGRHLPGFLGMIPVEKEKKETMRVLKEMIGLKGVGIFPDSPVSVLSGGERQGLAIGRALYFDSDIVILDEPTNALAVTEVGKVLSFIKKIKQMGKSAIVISHNLDHLYDVSDRFVFISHGRVAHSCLKEDLDLDSLTLTLTNLSHGIAN